MDIREKHEEAMNIMEVTIINPDIRKDKEKVKELNKRAFVLEKECAESLSIDDKHEPTRSVLYRSAAWLAIGAEQYQDALAMADEGLKGCIYGELKEELLEVKKEAEQKIK